MERTVALIGILRMNNHRHMPKLRMQHTMQELSVGHYAAANAGSDCEIDRIFQSLGLSVCYFSKQRSVDIRIKADRNMKLPLHRTDQIEISPGELWRRCDIAICFRITVKINRPEGRNSQCLYRMCLKPLKDLRYGFFRCRCFNRDLLLNFSEFITNRTNHFGSASF